MLGLGFRAQSYRYFNDLVRMGIVNQARTTDRLTFTASNDAIFSCGSHNCSFVRGKQTGWEWIATGVAQAREVRGSSRRSQSPESRREYQKIENYQYQSDGMIRTKCIRVPL